MQFYIIKHITTNTEQDYLTLFSSLVISNYIFLYDKHQLWTTQKLQLIFQHWMKLFSLLKIQFLSSWSFYFMTHGTFSSTIKYIVHYTFCIYIGCISFYLFFRMKNYIFTLWRVLMCVFYDIQQQYITTNQSC